MPHEAAAIENLAHVFRRFGERECVPASPLYGRLAIGIAGDTDLLRLATASAATPVPNLFLAAAHYLLIAEPTHPLAAFYPHLRQHVADDGLPELETDPFALFRTFCLQRAHAMRSLLATRRVQTNEVRRCACLLPAFGIVAQRTGRPLALVEVGASAGLNLLWDRYFYDYGTAGTCGDPASAVRLRCELRGMGRPPLPASMPAVATRAGVDLNPIDLRDPDQALWLRALIWPEQADRAALLEHAVPIVRADPPPLHAGDALAVLPELLERVPPDAALIIYHSFVLNQFPAPARARFNELIEGYARGRDLDLLSFEWREPAPPVVLTTFQGGERAERQLAICDAHGSWMEWVA